MAGLTNEQLQDSAATLRLVDDLVAELARTPDVEQLNAGLTRMVERLHEQSSDARNIERAFVRMYAELQRILYQVRQSRGLLEESALSHLETTSAKLQEVSSTTEHAATNMLDGVDRALATVDRIEEDADDEEAFQSLREELYALVVALQFQDISSQQLEHACAIIADLEGQLRRVVQLFAMSVFGDGESESNGSNPFQQHPAGAFDPAASAEDAANRQAVADDIFKAG